MYRAEEIGISLGTGLSRVRHRVDNYTDKSRPKDNMPDWWISSTWTSPPVSDDDDDDNDDVDIDLSDKDGDHPHHGDDNHDDNNNGAAAIAAS